MKKTLAIFLALIMILSVALASCNNKKPTSSSADDDPDNDFVAQTKTDDSGKNGTDTGNNNTPTGVWTAANYAIYIMGNKVNIRSDANTGSNSKVLGSANIGDTFTATETNGEWYKISYNDATAYINASYITTNQDEATFEECEATPLKVKDEVVDKNAEKDIDKYAKVWLRTDPAITDDTATKYVLIYSDTANGELVKVGQNKAGTWYKVEYNNGTYYIGSLAFKYFEGYTGNTGGLG